MAVRPFWFCDTVELLAGGSGTAVFRVSAGETARFKKLRYSSTGTFRLTSIRDSTAKQYSDTSISDPIVSDVLARGQVDGNPLDEFSPPIELKGDINLLFDLQDTSGSANTVRLYIIGEKEV